MFLAAGFFIYVLLSSCSVISEENCGPHFSNTDNGDGLDIHLWETGMNGNYRYYQRNLQVTNVCPDEHVSATFLIHFYDPDNDPTTLDDLAIPVTVRGWIFYAFFYPSEEDTMAVNQDKTYILSGNVEAGLKQQFGDSPAEYWVNLEIAFETTGVESQDLNYVQTIVDSWKMETEYFEYKGN
jgi:hypothetical protein